LEDHNENQLAYKNNLLEANLHLTVLVLHEYLPRGSTMIRSLKNAYLSLLMVAVLAPTVALSADFKVVASSDFNYTQFSRAELRDLYLGLIQRNENGRFVQATHGPIGAPYMEKFLSQIIEMSSREFVTHWRGKLFSSRGIPPRSFPSDEQVVFYLHVTPQALGIVGPTADTGTLKVLSLLE
jgi:hypothetical protein